MQIGTWLASQRIAAEDVGVGIRRVEPPRLREGGDGAGPVARRPLRFTLVAVLAAASGDGPLPRRLVYASDAFGSSLATSSESAADRSGRPS